MTKQISIKDREKLLSLYTEAQNTPVIIMKTGDRSFADIAWDVVREFQKELGKKYEYNWETHGIDGDGNVCRV